jgi:hypothetical protein
VKTIQFLLNPFIRSRRNERYYQGVIGAGVGYPTYDEARRDLMSRDRAVFPQAGWR